MENHPIPQDITGFQFKLIGDMTIKQFAYLGAGVVLGFIMFSLPITPIIKIPIALIFVLIGVSLAYLPIEGRPMDAMIYNFIRAIFSPTQFVYEKPGTDIAQPNLIQEEKPKNELDKKEMVFFQSIANMPTQSTPAPVVTPAPTADHAYAAIAPKEPIKADLPVKEEKPEDQEGLKKETELLQKELQEAKKQENTQAQGSQEYELAHKKVTELETSLNEVVFQKQELEKKLLMLQQQLAEQNKVAYAPSAMPQAPAQTQHVRTVPQTMAKTVGTPLAPEFPNIVSGIVKDPRGNPLPNILVEVKDNEGNAVRAFKTNALGQFASATPLTNGEYKIEFEDGKAQNKFDSVVFSATGQVIPAIEVISIDTREELRRSLFAS